MCKGRICVRQNSDNEANYPEIIDTHLLASKSTEGKFSEVAILSKHTRYYYLCWQEWSGKAPKTFTGCWILFLYIFFGVYSKNGKGPIRFCHFQEKTKILKLLLQLKEGIILWLKILGCVSVVE